jgi:hypothetical protein
MLRLWDRLQECWDKDDPTIEELRKGTSDCPGCGKQAGYWVPDGRFICISCSPQAVVLRWQNLWEAKERRRKRHERIVATKNHPSVPLSVQLAQREKFRQNREHNNEVIKRMAQKKSSEDRKRREYKELQEREYRELQEIERRTYKQNNKEQVSKETEKYIIATPFGGGEVSSGVYTAIILMNLCLFFPALLIPILIISGTIGLLCLVLFSLEYPHLLLSVCGFGLCIATIYGIDLLIEEHAHSSQLNQVIEKLEKEISNNNVNIQTINNLNKVKRPSDEEFLLKKDIYNRAYDVLYGVAHDFHCSCGYSWKNRVNSTMPCPYCKKEVVGY